MNESSPLKNQDASASGVIPSAEQTSTVGNAQADSALKGNGSTNNSETRAKDLLPSTGRWAEEDEDENEGAKKNRSWKDRILFEISEIGLVIVYLATAFCIVQTFRCATLLAKCSENDFLASYATALVTSLVLGKFVFVVEKMKIAKHFENEPLVYPVLYKSVLFTGLVFAVLHFEQRFLHEESNLASPLTHPETFWPCFLAQSIAFFTIFLIFFAFRDIARVIGRKRMRRLFFISRD